MNLKAGNSAKNMNPIICADFPEPEAYDDCGVAVSGGTSGSRIAFTEIFSGQEADSYF